MVAIRNALLFVATATAAIIARDVTTIKNDLATINSDTTSLTKQINAYTGGVAASIPIQNAEQALEKAITSATTDAQNSAVLSSSDSQSVIAYITGTLEPNIKACITALDSKKSQAVAAGLQSEVQGDLNRLYSDTNTYGTALVAKASSDQQSNAKAALAKVLADLQTGINYWKS